MTKSHPIANKRFLFPLEGGRGKRGVFGRSDLLKVMFLDSSGRGLEARLAELVGREPGCIKRRSAAQKRSLKLEFATVFDICWDFRPDRELGGLLLTFSFPVLAISRLLEGEEHAGIIILNSQLCLPLNNLESSECILVDILKGHSHKPLGTWRL